ncbi:hypothetical protein G6F43_010016 [Rhizopus delemar]|nr:hypothetical protein G6F43_010016 [Rhizopus delemar]
MHPVIVDNGGAVSSNLSLVSDGHLMMCALFDTHTHPTTALLTSFVKSLSTDLTDDELNELNPVGRLTAVMSTQIGLSHLGGKTTMGCESLGDRHACVYSWLFQQIH